MTLIQNEKLADGSDVAEGTKADAPYTGSGNTTAIGGLKGIYAKLAGVLTGNVTQVGGTNVDTNSGNKSSGTVRVVVATDQPELTNPLKVDPSAVTSPISIADGAFITVGSKADSAQTNPGITASLIAYIKGILTAVNNILPKGRTTMANSAPVTMASDQVAFPVTVDQGTDPVGTNAGTQAGSTTGGVGVRGWLSTLAGLFQGGLAKTNVRKLDLVDDSVRTVADQANSAALTSVAASASTGVLVAANAKSSSVTGRMGLIIVNDSASATLYLAYAATASLTAYTEKVSPGQTWEMPNPIYAGAIAGIWDAAVGNARITELS